MSSLLDCCYDYRWEAPIAKIFTYCDVCGEPIYVGDDYYKIDGKDICDDCINDFRKVAEGE